MRVDFYILPDSSEQARERLSCRLAEKAYKSGHTVFLYAESEQQAQRLDEMLWTFRAGSFIPHALGAERLERPPPVLIGNSDPPSPVPHVLITLSNAVPPFFERFERIAEIVDQTAQNRQSGRDRFRFYRDRGLQPHAHRLG